jgi:prepilin-type N-terminal cleavage/methylation domain-containing protein
MVRLSERRRAGFTLIELLVVIAIIAVLAALTAGAVLKFMGVQPVSNTKLTLRKLQNELRRKWTEVTEQARRDPMLSQDPCAQAAIAIAGLSPNAGAPQELTRLIYIKIKQKQAFPETYAEAVNGFTVAGQTIKPLAAFVTELNKYGVTVANHPAGTNPKDYESSVCLLMALKRGVAGGAVTDEALGLNNISTKLTGGAPYLIDAWGNPVLFSRWPLGNTNTPQADPTDPQGLLVKMAAASQTAFSNGLNAGNGIHAVVNSTANFLTPTIASVGVKGGTVLDLTKPGQTTHWQPLAAAQAQWNDVIYSNNVP